MTDEANKSDAEKTWENLKKPYLTTDQKLAIIQEYNHGRGKEEWSHRIAELKDWLEKCNK